MIIHELSGITSPELERALHQFEALFSCSLGGGRSYRLTYPDGYLSYLEALGDYRCFAAEKDGQIVGMVGGAVMRVRNPDGTERPVVFAEEVKLVPAVRSTRILFHLLDRFQEWMLGQSDLVMFVVLDETPVKPTTYTGRAGIRPFREINRLVVLRVSCPRGGAQTAVERFFVNDQAGTEAHRQLCAGRYAMLSEGAERRSEIPPAWLVHPSGAACARIEDRRKVRRVMVDDGSELRPLFFGSFAFGDPRAGAELIAAALARGAALGFSALRMVVPLQDYQQLMAVASGGRDLITIPAGLYATGVDSNVPWVLSGLEV